MDAQSGGNSALIEQEDPNAPHSYTQLVSESMREILAVLNSNRPLSETLDCIIVEAGRLLGTNSGAIFRLEEGRGVVAIQAARGLPVEYVANVSIPIGQGAVGLSVQSHQAVVVPDIETWLRGGAMGLDTPRRDMVRTLTGWYASLLAVPLVMNGHVYGALVLYYRSSRDFAEGELALASVLGDYVALAIENARLRERAELAAVEAERTRLARDLHDSVTQTLFSAGLIADVLPGLWERSTDEGKRRLDELQRLIKGALAEMRMLLVELRPASLTEAGLGELLRQLCDATGGRAHIPVELEVHGQRVLPADVQVALYRIAQEAMNNVARHANATRAQVVLRLTPESADLMVSDDGRGFDASGPIRPEHLGLRIMRERAEASGAHVAVYSRPGQGTQVRATWPGTLPGEGKR
jgi:signal transduction histidine kinase